MKVAKLSISNFRGIKCAELYFEGHTLLVGSNNVGKSTICEALDLVLSPDRLNRFPPVDEFDFYNANYLAGPKNEGDEPGLIPIRLQVVLVDLDTELENRCGNNIQFWHISERRILGPGEAESANPPNIVTCLPIETIAKYNTEEDEFEARTYYSHSYPREYRARPFNCNFLQPIQVHEWRVNPRQPPSMRHNPSTHFDTDQRSHCYDQDTRLGGHGRQTKAGSPRLRSRPPR